MAKKKTFREVRKAVIDSDFTYEDLAKITGFSTNRISLAINGHKVSDKVKRSLALALGRSYEELWKEKTVEGVRSGKRHIPPQQCSISG